MALFTVALVLADCMNVRKEFSRNKAIQQCMRAFTGSELAVPGGV